MGQSDPWLIYALGGGWGHLNRAVALGRLVTAQCPVHILTNSPYAALVSEELERWRQQGQPIPTLITFPTSLEKTALCRQIQAQILSQPYCCLVVDTFPRGLGGELADLLPRLRCPKVFIHRDLNPDYVRSHGLLEFSARHYDSIIVPGEDAVSLALLPQSYSTPPWLIYSAAELTARLQAQAASNPDIGTSLHPCVQAAPLVLVCAAGNAAEQAFFGTLTNQLHQSFPNTRVRCLSAVCPPNCPPKLWLQAWPGLPWIAQSAVVVGGGGYNTVYECVALKKPLIGFAWPRLYDRQARRLARYGMQVSTTSEAIEQVRRILQGEQHDWQIPGSASSHCIPPYPNGATNAYQQIQQLLEAWTDGSRKAEFSQGK